MMIPQNKNVRQLVLRWAGHVARMEEGRTAFKILTENFNDNPPRDSEANIWVHEG